MEEKRNGAESRWKGKFEWSLEGFVSVFNGTGESHVILGFRDGAKMGGEIDIWRDNDALKSYDETTGNGIRSTGCGISFAKKLACSFPGV